MGTAKPQSMCTAQIYGVGVPRWPPVTLCRLRLQTRPVVSISLPGPLMGTQGSRQREGCSPVLPEGCIVAGYLCGVECFRQGRQ